MANLLTFIQSASKPTERVKRLIEFIDNVDEYRENMEIFFNFEDRIAILLKFDEPLNKINALINDFVELDGDVERYPFNSRIKNLGLEYSGFEKRGSTGLIVYFKKLHQI